MTNRNSRLPAVIQGGMGVGVSGWRLARAVATTGQLGVVSGVALDVLLARRLQRGDPGGQMRRALANFPVPEVAHRVLARYFVPGGVESGRPYRPVYRIAMRPRQDAEELSMVANFVEVFLAKDGHDGPIGINFLEKIQLATPAAMYGAMLAGVDYVLMGAGLPTEIPRLLDNLARHAPAELTISVDGALKGERFSLSVVPEQLVGAGLPPLRRPRLLAIVSAATLAIYLARSEATRPEGFVVETRIAGGHSAAPRGKLTLTEAGEPAYGPRDEIDLAKIAAVGLPFWLAGGYASPERLAHARESGAQGVQVGTAFALCRESGIPTPLRVRLIAEAVAGTLDVRNRAEASPTGFPFKLVELDGSVSDDTVFGARPRLCDLGYLRSPYRRGDGTVGYRCPAEPVDAFVRKGGVAENAEGRRCLCNGLVATIGLGQHRSCGYQEPALVTLGQDLSFLPRLPFGFSAVDIVDYLLEPAVSLAS